VRSLRSRLIVGAALVAIVPLGLAILFFTQRIETMVREQADARLEEALGGIRADLSAATASLAGQLQTLGGDPTLLRLYLMRAPEERELAGYLADRRSLLRLDRLRLRDLSGRVVAGDPADRGEGDPASLSARAPILYRGAPSGFVEAGRTIDPAFLERVKRASGLELVLRDGAGRTRAATLPEGSAPYVAPAVRAARLTLGGTSYLGRTLPLDIGADSLAPAAITGLVPTADSDRAIASLRTTALLLGALGIALAFLLGTLWSAQLSRPVERIAAFSRELAQGRWERPLAVKSVRELETLVEALERMRRDLQDYRERLVVSERQAAWSGMARRVAHEIKNPLTPIAISIEDLKRSFEQGREDFPAILDRAVRTIGEEIATMTRLLREFTEYGSLPAPRLEPVRIGALLADIEALYARDVSEARLRVDRGGVSPDQTFSADAGLVRQALVNLVKNGLEAIAPGGLVSVSAAPASDDGAPAAEFVVEDDGPGLSDEQRANLFLPGFTTKPGGSGLGLGIVERIVSEHGGTIRVERPGARGTRFRLRFPPGGSL
jgi:nitrogen fixation/metabolism regulation signal transduction histidine kinase